MVLNDKIKYKILIIFVITKNLILNSQKIRAYCLTKLQNMSFMCKYGAYMSIWCNCSYFYNKLTGFPEQAWIEKKKLEGRLAGNKGHKGTIRKQFGKYMSIYVRESSIAHLRHFLPPHSLGFAAGSLKIAP